MADVNYQEEPLEAGEPVTARPTTWRDSKALKRFRRNPLAIVGLLVVVVFVLTAVFAPVITDVGRNCLRDLGLSAATQNDYKNPTKAVFWRTMFAPPDSCFTIPRVGFSNVPRTAEVSETLLGTTSGGYDIYYGLIWGTRTAFKIGLLVVGISLLAGLIIGSVSGYVGGVLDNVLMRFTDIVISLPSLVVAMVVVMPPYGHPSSTSTTRFVFATVCRIASTSSGRSVRRSSTSASIPSFSSCCAACRTRLIILP